MSHIFTHQRHPGIRVNVSISKQPSYVILDILSKQIQNSFNMESEYCMKMLFKFKFQCLLSADRRTLIKKRFYFMPKTVDALFVLLEKSLSCE